MSPIFILLALLFALLAWRDLKLAVFVLAGTLPIYLLRFEILGVPSTMLEVMVWVLVGVWVVHGLRDHRWKIGGRAESLRLPITLLLLAAVISTFVAPDTTAALGILKAYFVEPLLVFVLVVSVFDRDDLPKLFIALGASALVLSLYAIVQKLTGLGIPEPWDTARRVTSVFPYPNALGLFLGPVLAAWFFVPGRYVAKKKGLFAVVAFFLVVGLGSVAIGLALTEAALVALPAAVILTSFLSNRTRTMGVLVAAILILLSLFAGNWSYVSEKITLRDYSGQVRLSQWGETWDYLRDDNHWLLGAGLSGYPSALAPYHHDTQYEIFLYPHNIILNTLVELGLLGLIAFAWLAIEILRIVRRHRNEPLILAAFAGLLEMTIHGLVDVPYFKNDLAILTWLLIAVVIVSSKTTTTAFAQASFPEAEASR